MPLSRSTASDVEPETLSVWAPANFPFKSFEKLPPPTLYSRKPSALTRSSRTSVPSDPVKATWDPVSEGVIDSIARPSSHSMPPTPTRLKENPRLRTGVATASRTWRAIRRSREAAICTGLMPRSARALSHRIREWTRRYLLTRTRWAWESCRFMRSRPAVGIWTRARYGRTAACGPREKRSKDLEILPFRSLDRHFSSGRDRGHHVWLKPVILARSPRGRPGSRFNPGPAACPPAAYRPPPWGTAGRSQPRSAGAGPRAPPCRSRRAA